MRCLILVSLVLICSAPAHADVGEGPSCAQKGRRFVPVDGSVMMALRSNGCHYWAWAKVNAGRFLPADVLSMTGVVAGDPHHENFSHVTIGGVRKFVLNDMDDSGVAPYFLDYLKFMGVSRSVIGSKEQLSSRRALEAYVAGLQGKPWSDGVPRLLREDHDMTEGRLHDDYLEKIHKRQTKGEFNEAEGLVPWRGMTGTDRADLSAFENEIASTLPQGWNIKDRAIFKKGRGGSGDVRRYWFYVKRSDDERHILEFKRFADPATGNYQKQMSTAERIPKVVGVFWGRLPQPFNVVNTKFGTFWVRPKYPVYVNFSYKDFLAHPKNFAELTYYIAYTMGRLHGGQGGAAGYREYVGQHVDELIAAGDGLVDDYIQEARRLQGR